MAKRKGLTVDSDFPTLLVQGMLFIYIIADMPMAPEVASFGRTMPGLAMVSLLALSAFAVMGPVTGVLSLAAAYIFLSKAESNKDNNAAQIGKTHMDNVLSSLGKLPEASLEEDMVATMAPPLSTGSKTKAEYVPMLTNQHNLGTLLS
tara:strand:+ start:1702 stop:2145 length:444 start_codon:yes stop_codon:yes gene_type:complete